MSIPAACHLWHKPTLTPEDIDPRRFERVAELVDERDLWRVALRCPDCGQVYLYESYDVLDWDTGKESHYTTLIPVASLKEATALAQRLPIELLRCSPRLQETQWVGRDEGGE